MRAAPNRCLPPSLARVPSRLVPRVSFRALFRRINDTIQLTWELLLRDPSQRFQTETEMEMEGAPRQLKIHRSRAVQHLNGSPPGQTPAPAAPLTTAGGQTLRHTPGATPAPGAPFVVRSVTALTPTAPAVTAHSGQAATTGHSHWVPGRLIPLDSPA